MAILAGIEPLLGPPVVGSIQTALQQPIFPGKVIVWLLFMLSIVSWVMILSKAFHLAKLRRVDRNFATRLRESRTTLEVFEEGWDEEESLQHSIYLAGSREAAFHLLGSREPQEGMHRRLRRAPKLTARQLDFLNLAFRSGYRSAMLSLSSGIAGFRFVAVAALLLGAVGLVWTLMSGFDSAAGFEEISPMVGAALGFLMIALLVATPAILARIAFDIHIRRRKVELEKFRDDIARLFERSYAAGAVMESPIRQEVVRPEEPETNEPVSKSPVGEEERKKKYHSIRDRLLRDSGEGEGGEEPINPIAQQAATFRVR